MESGSTSSLKPPESIPLQLTSQFSVDGDFPLQDAAKYGKVDELRALLDQQRDLFLIDHRGRTCLHWAASFPNHKIALECVRLILDCPQVSRAVKGQTFTKYFVDIQDGERETALHLAAKNEAKKIVELLIFSAADVNLRSVEGKDPLCLIYNKIPTAMISVLNVGINIKEGSETTDENLRLIVNFGAIIGYPTKEETKYGRYLPRETELLSYALDCAHGSSKEILVHPLVQLFLELKWQKIHYLFWASILFHIIWLLLYTVFIAEVYLQSCPYHLKNNGSQEDPGETVTPVRFSWFGFPDDDAEGQNAKLKSEACSLSSERLWILNMLVIMTLIVGLKEIFELSSVRKARTYFTGIENIGQWLLIISVFVLIWPVIFSMPISDWIYEVAAFGIFVAWSLVLSQIGKHPRLGLHVEILAKVLKSFAMFMLTFASLLIAFALSLSLLLPGNSAFVSLPLAFMKVLVMMTGELEYNDFFEGDKTAAFPVSGRIIYLLFVIIVTIILFNLLIGFTVSDIQGLQKRAEINKLCNQLEQIYLMESFILSKKMQRVFCSRRSILKRFLVASPVDDSGDDPVIEISIREIPQELQKRIRILASVNSSSEGFSSLEPSENADETTKILKAILKEVMKSKGLS